MFPRVITNGFLQSRGQCDIISWHLSPFNRYTYLDVSKEPADKVLLGWIENSDKLSVHYSEVTLLTSAPSISLADQLQVWYSREGSVGYPVHRFLPKVDLLPIIFAGQFSNFVSLPSPHIVKLNDNGDRFKKLTPTDIDLDCTVFSTPAQLPNERDLGSSHGLPKSTTARGPDPVFASVCSCDEGT